MAGNISDSAVTWIDRPVEIRAEDGVIVATVRSGGEVREFRSSPAILVATMGNMARCYAGLLATKGAKIIPLRKRLPKH